ncbi:MAG: histone deacetylase family protein [Sediminispirochaetaceae bacterium]
MHLLYFPGLPDLLQFGIQIPVLDTRATTTLERLSAHPIIGPRLADLLEQTPLEKISREDIARVHSRDYVDRIYSDKLEEVLLEAFELIDEQGAYNRYDPAAAVRPLTDLFGVQLIRTAGSLQSMRKAIETDACFFFGGGFHHAHAGFGHGFCFINDIVIGIRRLQHEGIIRKAWVIDTDAHKGDGTASLTADDDSIASLSIHMAGGWPLDRPEFDGEGRRHPSFTPSTVDIPIPEGGEAEYAAELSAGLQELQRIAPDPDLAVVVYGADPYEKDGLPSTGSLSLSLERMGERDHLVYSFLREKNVPAAYLMAGGYGPHAWEVYYQFLEETLAASISP